MKIHLMLMAKIEILAKHGRFKQVTLKWCTTKHTRKQYTSTWPTNPVEIIFSTQITVKMIPIKEYQNLNFFGEKNFVNEVLSCLGLLKVNERSYFLSKNYLSSFSTIYHSCDYSNHLNSILKGTKVKLESNTYSHMSQVLRLFLKIY